LIVLINPVDFPQGFFVKIRGCANIFRGLPVIEKPSKIVAVLVEQTER
jgi:hypothetical protein